MTNPKSGMSNSLSWWGIVLALDELEEFMGSYFKVPKGYIRMIDNFIAVDSCVKCPYIAKLC